MVEKTIHEDAAATLTRLQAKHPALKGQLRKAHGFAVFPAIGRASAVLGGAYGHGEVYERGKPIGFCTLSQMTIGVQVGGQTFSELVIFKKPRSMEQFKRGKVAFNANASAVLIKAAASGTTNLGDVEAHAYARGGMLLELSLGGQKFSFQPPRRDKHAKPEQGEQGEQTPKKKGVSGKQGAGEKRLARSGRGNGHPDASAPEEEGGQRGWLKPVRRLGGVMKEHPIASSALGLGLSAAAALLAAARRPLEETVEGAVEQ